MWVVARLFPGILKACLRAAVGPSQSQVVEREGDFFIQALLSGESDSPHASVIRLAELSESNDISKTFGLLKVFLGASASFSWKHPPSLFVAE